MRLLFYRAPQPRFNDSRGFSLIEVVLAIGIFLVTVLSLVGLLGPTLQSVNEVEQTDEVASVVNSVNAFLQSSEAINPDGSKFDAIYEAVYSGGYATIFVFREFTNDDDPTEIELQVGFSSEEDAIDDDATLDASTSTFEDAAGSIYRVVLSASSVTPEDLRSASRSSSTDVYTLSVSDPDQYSEGYLALEVRIFAEAPGPTFDPTTDLTELADQEPIFTYNTAIVR
jgi:Tfp pilus assembly protein PilV